jgi:hypothetical protein
MTDLAKLVQRAEEMNSDNFHVMVEYSGHVDAIHLRVFVGGWYEGADTTHKDAVWREFGTRTAADMLNNLEDFYKEFVARGAV